MNKRNYNYNQDYSKGFFYLLFLLFALMECRAVGMKVGCAYAKRRLQRFSLKIFYFIS